MSYGSPADPVSLTVITVAWQVANVMTPLRWLRLMTGNADPPGANYVVVSDSTTGTSWKKIPADALAPGVVAANLGYVPANKAGDVFSGDVSALGFAAGAHGVSGGTGGFDTTGPYNGGSKILGAALKLVGLDIGALGISNAGPYDGGTISDGDIAVQGASVGAHGVSSTGNIASAGNTSGFQLVSTVANYASPPIVVDPNQGGVPVPNLYAAKAQSADAATTAAQLAGVDASHYARKDAPTDFTTVPTINGNGIIRTDTIGIQSVAAAIVAAVANSVQAGSVTDVGIAAGNKNGTAATFSMRKLGTGSTDAAAGDHTHSSGVQIAAATYSGTSASHPIAIGFQPKAIFHLTTTGTPVSGMTLVSNTTIFFTPTPSNLISSGSGITFTSTGFTLGNTNFNASGTTYAYVAIG
jgi:hypothetical protein